MESRLNSSLLYIFIFVNLTCNSFFNLSLKRDIIRSERITLLNLMLIIVDPIAINAPVTQYTPTLQTTVTLQCDVTQGTANQIIWIKDNVQLNINNNNRLTGGTVATESLTITNVQQSDGGNYVCRGIDAVTGNIVNTDTINVAPVGKYICSISFVYC